MNSPLTIDQMVFMAMVHPGQWFDTNPDDAPALLDGRNIGWHYDPTGELIATGTPWFWQFGDQNLGAGSLEEFKEAVSKRLQELLSEQAQR
jgi:hypothetical protein